MSRTFYNGSGSPFAWRVWLALEHKQLSYELRTLSFDRNEHKTPEFLAINPRGKVPALVDGEFTLWESGAILEYLEDRYPERPILPKDPAGRAIARRIAAEADNYLYPLQRPLMMATLYTPAAERDAAKITAAEDAVLAELGRFAGYLKGDEWFAGPLSLADFTVFPYLRMAQRIEERVPELTISRRFPPAITAYLQRFAALPYAEKTLPPHWKG
jgi:glutathione S-transferase